MEEIEVPVEHLTEEINHHASHETGWFMGVALSSAFLAALAAVAALLAGHYSNEAMLEQLHASDTWSYYQAKGIKSAVLSSKLELLEQMKLKPRAEDQEKVVEYKKEQSELMEKGKELEVESKVHLQKHVIFARSVTMFQVAIAISAIAVLTRKRRFWYFGLCFGVFGLGFFIQGFF